VIVIIFIAVAWLEANGFVLQLAEKFPQFEDFPPHIFTYITGAIFLFVSVVKEFNYRLQKPALKIENWGWQSVRNGERLYLKVTNKPLILSSKRHAYRTGAEISLYNNRLTKRLANFENVRWEGTHGPVKAKDYQPYDYWAVDIDCGRKRKLYLAARSSLDDPSYIVSDDSYFSDGKWFSISAGIKIPDKAYFRVTLWASDYEYKNHWFKYKKGRLIVIKRNPKNFNETKIIDAIKKAKPLDDVDSSLKLNGDDPGKWSST